MKGEESRDENDTGNVEFIYRPAGLFGGLLLEHLEISLLAIAIAIVVGGFAGIVISEYSRLAKPTLGVVNFLYTIPSISMLGFLIPFSGVGNATAVIALTVYALASHGAKHLHRDIQH